MPRQAGGAVFFDRDGVLNRLVLRDGRFVSPRTLADFELNDTACLLVEHLGREHVRTFVVTNQPDVARGYMSIETLEQMHHRLRASAPVTDIAFCPHDDAAQCECRKPKAGMLLQLAQRWNVQLGQSVMIGDSWRDVEAGRRVGCTTVLIEGTEAGHAEPDYRAESISEAADIIGARFRV